MAALENELYIGDLNSPMYLFTNDEITSVTSQQSVSISGDHLAVDTLTPEVNYVVKLPEVIRPLHSEESDFELECIDGATIDLGLYLDREYPHRFAFTEITFKITEFPTSNRFAKFNKPTVVLLSDTSNEYAYYLAVSYDKIFNKYYLEYRFGNKTDGSSRLYEYPDGETPLEKTTIKLDHNDKSIYINNKLFTTYREDWSGSSHYHLMIGSSEPGNYIFYSFKKAWSEDGINWTYTTGMSDYYSPGIMRPCILRQYFNEEPIPSRVLFFGEDNIDSVTRKFRKVSTDSNNEKYYSGILTKDNFIFCGHYSEFDIRTLPYGTPMWYYHRSALVGKFYLKSVDRIAKNIYRLNAIDEIGLLDKQESYGGLFDGKPFNEVVNEILNPTLIKPYEAVQYIETGSGQYIDTEIVHNGGSTDLIIGFELVSMPTTTEWFYGTYAHAIGISPTGLVISYYPGGGEYEQMTTIPYSFQVGVRYGLQYLRSAIYLSPGDGTTIFLGYSQIGVRDTKSSIYIGTYNMSDDGSPAHPAAHIRITHATITGDSNMHASYMPYRRNSDNAGMMYEFKTGTIVGSSSGIPFISGPVNNPNESVQESSDVQLNISYDPGVAEIPVYGWLPCASKRDNLYQLLFAYSVYIIRNPDGSIRFSWLSNINEGKVDDNKTYLEGSVSYSNGIDNIKITEHAYMISDEATETMTTLYDNSKTGDIADHDKIVFSSSPIIFNSLQTTGTLKIDFANVNFAIVSGTGVLYGIPYTDSQRIISKRPFYTSDILETNEIEVSDCSLITMMNSNKVMNRLWNYYNSESKVQSVIEYNGEKCGQFVHFYTPYNEATSGFIQKISLNKSANIKANCEIISGYTPEEGGNDFSNFVVLTGTGTWHVPENVDLIRIVMFSGGAGGSTGYAAPMPYTDGFGDGGEPGIPGSGGRILIKDIESPDSYYQYSCGTGGEGGKNYGENGTNNNSNTVFEGMRGTDTTVTGSSGESYTTADASSVYSGFYNILNKTVYGSVGDDNGVKGGSSSTNGVGGSVSFNGIIYYGGNPASTAGIDGSEHTAGGGGAAVGTRGQDAYISGTWYDGQYYPGAVGGEGATPIAREAEVIIGKGGTGGHGGGAGGMQQGEYGGSPGMSGKGGIGGNGGPGGLIIFY